MHIVELTGCPEFIAGDTSLLREIINPLKQDIKINYSLAWASVDPGNSTKPHSLTSSEVYFILAGSGRMYIDETSKEVKKNDTIYIPPHARQYIQNTGSTPLEFLCIVDPAWCREREEILE